MNRATLLNNFAQKETNGKRLCVINADGVITISRVKYSVDEGTGDITQTWVTELVTNAATLKLESAALNAERKDINDFLLLKGL